MSNIERLVGVSITLGVVSLVALLPMHMALTDIGRGELDLTLEWWTVRVAVLVILAWKVVGLWTLFSVKRVIARRYAP